MPGKKKSVKMGDNMTMMRGGGMSMKRGGGMMAKKKNAKRVFGFNSVKFLFGFQ